MDIELTIKNYRCFSDDNPARFRIKPGFTAFIGINNSGKSSLLKFFYEFRDLFRILSSSNIIASSSEGWQRTPLITSLGGNLQAFAFPSEITDNDEVFCNANNRDIQIQIRLTPNRGTEQKPIQLDITVPRGSTPSWTCKMYLGNREVPSDNLSFKENRLFQGSELVTDLSAVLNACEVFSSMLYIGAFRNAINVGADRSYYDIPVGQAFISQWNAWKTGPTKKPHEIAFQIEEDIAKIFEYPRLEILSSTDGQRLIMMINGKSYKVSELGSGLTQFFLVITSVAMRYPPPSFILIDEPEINLHPSLQLDFLTRLTSYARHGLIFATHNIGLARTSADQIYTLRRNTDSLSEINDYDSTPRLAELLGELSYEAYKERGFDKILLVEGPSDLRVIQQFLRLYGKEHDITLLQMGGGQLIKANAKTELEEIQRISHNISVIIDSERTKPDTQLKPDRAAFVAVCESLNIQCHVLERRALDNYLSDRAVKEYKGNNYRALEPYDLLKGPHMWDKANNWRIAGIMTEEELDETDLGKFLKSL